MTNENNMFQDRNVLVTGGTGFIGTNLINRLLSLSANVRATLHKKDPNIIDNRIEYIKCDLYNMEDCKKVVEGMDYVFMCAASTFGAAVTAENPLVYVTPNIIMNAQMLEASYFAGIKKFIFISSNAIYPPSGDRYVKEEEAFNGDPPDVYFGVSWMKRYTEILCRLYSEKLKNPMKTVIVRPSNVYGPYDKFDLNLSHVTSANIRKVIDRHDPIQIWGTGNDIRDLIYIDDFIDGLILAAENMYNDAVNIAYGKGYSIKEVLQMMLEIDGYDNAKIVYDSTKPSMIPIRLIDTTKAKKLLGFKAKTNIREGIKKTIDWYRENLL